MQSHYYSTYDYISLTSPKAASTLINNVHTYINSLDGVKLTHHHDHLDTKKILVCRNPYTRCLSAYYNKFLALKLQYTNLQQLYRHKKLRALNSKNKQWQNVYAAFYTLATTNNDLSCLCANLYTKVDYIQPINDSFREYVKFLKNGWLKRRWFTNNDHFNPQVDVNSLVLFDCNLQIVKLEDNFTQNILKALECVIPEDVFFNCYNEIISILKTRPNQNNKDNKDIVSGCYADYTSEQWINFIQCGGNLAGISNMLDADIVADLNEMFMYDYQYLDYNL